MPDGMFGWPGRGIPEAENIDYQVFTASGTWTKPAGARWVQVYAVGGGGGGGSGYKGPDGGSRFGGASGEGGNATLFEIEASAIPNSVPILIGAGGAGGAARTTNSTNGLNGAYGGDSRFGLMVYGRGGATGAGGSSTSGGGSSGTVDLYGMIQGNPSQTGTTVGISFTALSGTFMANFGSPCGGAGTGVTSSNVPAVVYKVPSRSMSNSIGTLPIMSGTGGTRGQGSRTSGEVTTGGDGLLGGGGGGGGGGTNDIVDSGAGGRGGNGFIVVRTIMSRTSPLLIQQFSEDGTWNKPTDSRLTRARIFVIGGGGGGGGGQRTAAGVASAGGGGGGGSPIELGEFPLSVLPTSVQVIVGAGGTGGTASDASHGTNGNDGGRSAFGDFVVTCGARGGFGSATRTGGAGLTAGVFNGNSGGTGGSTANGGANSNGNGSFICSGGGGGGAVSSTDVRGTGAQSGPYKGYVTSTDVSNPAWVTNTASTAASTNGTSAIDPFPSRIGFYSTQGGAGGGAGNTTNTVAGNGGDGILGSGGGGGGGGRDGGSGGNGGNGGNGRVIVICF